MHALTDPAWQQTETDDAEADCLEDLPADDQADYRRWCDLMDDATAVTAWQPPAHCDPLDEMPV
jgi:hypothetical protein